MFGSILIDSSDAQKSISSTTKEAEGLGSKLANGIKTATKWAAGVTAAAVSVGASMVAAAKDTASNLDVIDKASIRMGIAAESYQELAYAAGLSGVSMTTLEKAAKSLVDTDMTFDEALDQIMAVGDESERTAMAVELFGEKVAYDMQPLLQSGADGLAAMKDEANELGLVLSQDTVSAGATMNDMFAKVEASIKTLGTQLMAEFMPYVMEILQWLIDNLPSILEAVKNVVDFIMPVVKPVLEAVMKIVTSTTALINGDIEGFIEGIKTAFIDLGLALYDIAKGIMTWLWEGLKEVWASVKEWLDEKIQWVKDVFASITSKTNIETDPSVYTEIKSSNASGLPYVPYDGYVAELHRGETVLNATSTSDLISKLDNIANSNNGPKSINLTISLGGTQIAQQLLSLVDNERQRMGDSLVTI